MITDEARRAEVDLGSFARGPAQGRLSWEETCTSIRLL